MSEPLVPAEVDLRGYEFMPFYGDRLFGSETWIRASAQGRVAMLRMWWRAYSKETPAASLPNDDQLLAEYAGYGEFPKVWAKLRAEVMRGWTLCSDGRLYHPFVAELAIEAYEFRQKQRAKTENARLARLSKSLSQKENGPPKPSVTESVKPLSQTPQDRTGQDRTEKQDSDTHPFPARPPAASPPADDARARWAGECCKALREFGGVGNVNPSHPDLLALFDTGLTPKDFQHTAEAVKFQHGPKPMAYHLAVIRRQQAEVAQPNRSELKAAKEQPDEPRPTVEAA